MVKRLPAGALEVASRTVEVPPNEPDPMSACVNFADRATTEGC
jgi:hypothetical protein